MRNLSTQLEKIFSFFVFGICCLWLFAVDASALTYSVTSTTDAGAGSLRQAVADANATTANDTINFNIAPTDPNCNASGVCTITLTGGVIVVQASSGTLTIANQTGASRLLISGNNLNRIFEVSQNANLTIDGVTVTRGLSNSSSGVISNMRGTLTVMNSIFTQNAGIYVIYSNAFQTSGVLNVINTTVSNNTAIGIFATNLLTIGGTANISNSTVSNNTAQGASGGNGGGIYFLGDQMTITNSTVSGNSNSGGGGIFAAMGTVTLTNCTVTGNAAVTSYGGGGILSFQSSVKLRNTIVAGNTSAGGTPDFNFPSSGIATSLGNNLIGNSINVGNPRGFWTASDILNQPARLAPLDNYGGATQTHALLPNSSAINAGNNCVLTANGCGDNNPAVPTDQRDAVRVRAVDIGAFELTSRAAFDFDGDGKADVSVFRPANGMWYLQQSSSGFKAVQFGISTDRLAPADYDGDGRADIAVFREGTFAYFYILQSQTNTFRFEQFGTTGDVPVSGDWDGDVKADLAVYRNGANPGGQSYFYYRPTATSGSDFRQIAWGTLGDKPTVGDYDADGKLDAAVFRPTNGVWYISHSSDNQLQTMQFGRITDRLVPADYDGDGKTDIAVFRSGVWYLQQSRLGFAGVQFGSEMDFPMPADFDGDGRADFAVFRNGAWYIQKSIQGFAGVAFGAPDDKPVPGAFIQ